jgi:hypothetical protein
MTHMRNTQTKAALGATMNSATATTPPNARMMSRTIGVRI